MQTVATAYGRTRKREKNRGRCQHDTSVDGLLDCSLTEVEVQLVIATQMS